MDPLIAKFEYISDASDEVDRLLKEAGKCMDRKERQTILKQAKELAEAYEKHVGRKIFNQF